MVPKKKLNFFNVKIYVFLVKTLYSESFIVLT